MRDTLLTFHILATGLWIGATVVGLIFNPRINSKASAIASDHWHLTVVAFRRYLYIPAYLILFSTGVVLGRSADDPTYKWTDTFNMIGKIAILFGVVVVLIHLARQGRKAAAAYDAGDTQAAASIEQKIAIWLLVDLAVVVLATVAMIGTWGV